MLSRKVLICLLFAFLLSACASKYTVVVDKSLQQKWLSFIEDGKTTNDEVLLKLGKPSGQIGQGTDKMKGDI